MINVTGTIAKSANIVKDSVVIGDVTIGEDSTVLFYAVLRGNDNKIVIGNGTNIQDNCTIHTSPVDPAIIGNHVTVGHNAIVHGCKIGDNTLIGMGGSYRHERQRHREKLSGGGGESRSGAPEYSGRLYGHGQTRQSYPGAYTGGNSGT